MSLISVDPGLIMEQLRKVQAAAEPLASAADPGSYSGSSAVVDEFLSLCGRLTACAAACYGALQSDVSKAGVLLDQLVAEDQQIGVMLSNE